MNFLRRIFPPHIRCTSHILYWLCLVMVAILSLSALLGTFLILIGHLSVRPDILDKTLSFYARAILWGMLAYFYQAYHFLKEKHGE